MWCGKAMKWRGGRNATSALTRSAARVNAVNGRTVTWFTRIIRNKYARVFMRPASTFNVREIRFRSFRCIHRLLNNKSVVLHFCIATRSRPGCFISRNSTALRRSVSQLSIKLKPYRREIAHDARHDRRNQYERYGAFHTSKYLRYGIPYLFED